MCSFSSEKAACVLFPRESVMNVCDSFYFRLLEHESIRGPSCVGKPLLPVGLAKITHCWDHLQFRARRWGADRVNNAGCRPKV